MALGFPLGLEKPENVLPIVVLAVWEVRKGEPVWERTRLDRHLLALGVIIFLSALWASGRTDALRWAALVAATTFLVVRALVLTTRRRQDFARWFLMAWAVGGAVAGLWALASLGPAVDSRAHLPLLDDPNAVGEVLATSLVIALGLSTAGPVWQRALTLGAVPVLAGALVVTFSLGAWLAGVVGVGVLLWTRGLRRLAPAVVAMGLTLLVAALFVAPSFRWHSVRFAQIPRAEGPFSRLPVWRVVPGMIADHPVLGVGFSKFGEAYERYKQPGLQPQPHAHNLVLTFAVETGLLGLTALIAVLGAAAVALWRWHAWSPADSFQHSTSATALAAFAVIFGHHLVDMQTSLIFGLLALIGLSAGSEGDALAR